MKDVVESLNQALFRQGWTLGDRVYRIGHPFEWVDADRQTHFYAVEGVSAVLQYMSMFYEQYPTPEEIATVDFDEMRQHCEQQLRDAYLHFAPFRPVADMERYITSTALVRTQDYAFIKTYCKDLGDRPIKHLDIGPGLGSHALWSLKGFSSAYYALEASPHSWGVQRNFFRFLSSRSGSYLDLVEAERFGLSPDALHRAVNDEPGYRIKHVPSWMFEQVAPSSLDIVTATWVLNEINFAGILWLMSHAARTLRRGGYVYIRDSGKLKPSRHAINYDQLLQDIGFARRASLDVRNRVDYFGIPRVYEKTTDAVPGFDELVERYIGRFAVVVHGGEYVQNVGA